MLYCDRIDLSEGIDVSKMCAMDVIMYFNYHLIVNGISKIEVKNFMQNIHLG